MGGEARRLQTGDDRGRDPIQPQTVGSQVDRDPDVRKRLDARVDGADAREPCAPRDAAPVVAHAVERGEIGPRDLPQGRRERSVDVRDLRVLDRHRVRDLRGRPFLFREEARQVEAASVPHEMRPDATNPNDGSKREGIESARLDQRDGGDRGAARPPRAQAPRGGRAMPEVEPVALRAEPDAPAGRFKIERDRHARREHQPSGTDEVRSAHPEDEKARREGDDGLDDAHLSLPSPGGEGIRSGCFGNGQDVREGASGSVE